MARRRGKAKTRTITRYVRATKRRSKRSSSVNFKNMLMPIAVATFTEPLIDNVAQMFPIPSIGGVQSDDLVKVGIGYFLGKKGGLVGNTAKMYGIFGLRNIIKGFTGGLMGVGAGTANGTGVQE